MTPSLGRVVFPTVGTRVGGSVVSTALIADGLRRHGAAEPRIALPSGAANARVFEALGLAVDDYGLGARAVGRFRRASGARGHLAAVPALVAAQRLALRYLRRHDAALVHVNDDRTLLPWGLAARRAGVPVVWHVRQERSGGALDRARLALADRLVFVADANRRRFRGAGRLPPSRRVHNWVDTRRFAPPDDRREAKARLGFDPDGVLIGFVGNLVPRKRPEWAVDAAIALRAEGLPVGLALAGEDFSGGDYARRLARTAAGAGAEAAVRLLGHRDDVAELMRAFDVLVLTSVPSGEAFPRSILEAMASGVAVVATRVAGVGEAIEDGVDGLLCDPNDFGDFRARLETLVRDAALRERLQRAALGKARAAFSEEVGIEAILDVYRDLLGAA